MARACRRPAICGNSGLPWHNRMTSHTLEQNLSRSTSNTPGDADESSPDSFYRHLLDAAPDAMVVVDANGRIVLVNAEAEKMFGWARSRLLGQPVESLMPARFRPRHVDHRTGYSAAPKLRGMGAGMELAGLRADGSEFPVEISLSPIRVGPVSYVASAIRDVTERQRIERELTEARNAAERAQKANTAFLAAASHDLRQPVQALNLIAGALKRTVKDPLALEMVTSQQASLDGMTNLLNSLMDVSRLDAGAFEPNVEEFSVRSLFGRHAAEWSRQARHKKLELVVEPGDANVRSDPHLLAEILQNFVSNAIRYTESGSIRVTAEVESGAVVITVSDTGIGIDADRLEDIFKEFYQIRNPAGKREGFGLGLAITRRLADLLGHSIRVESEPGQGSAFILTVPQASTAGSGPLRDPETGTDAASPSALVMLIEDDEHVVAGWRMLLRAEGFEVIVADSVESARAVAAGLETPPQLIISDYHLAEGSNGVDAVTSLRETFGSPVPAYIVTGDTSKIVQEVSSLANMRLMNKPVRPDELLRLVHTAVATGQA